MTPPRPPHGRSFSDASIAPSSHCQLNSVWLLSCVMCKDYPTTRSLPRCGSLRVRCGHVSAAAARRCASSWPILPRRQGPNGGHEEERLMTMGHVTELLSAYLDERVGADERARIVAHLDACESCRAHLESLRRTVALLHTAEPVRAPEGFRAQVRARIDAQPRRAPRTLRLPRWIGSWRTAGAVVAVVLIGLFTVNLLREQFPSVARRDREPQGSVPAPLPPSASVDRAARAPELSAPQAGGFPVPGRVGAPPIPAPYSPGEPALRRVIRTASVMLEVGDLDETASRLTRIAEVAGGFIADSSYAQAGSTPEGTFVLRVPAPRFAHVLSQVESLGHVQQRRISGQDVTEEYVDLRSRIRNLERYEQRLLALVDRAAKVSDLLEIEQELARVRGEIEMLTGRARYLDRQVDLAMIQVSAREQTRQSGGLWDLSGTLTKIQTAFVETIRQLLRAAEAAVVALSALVPVLALAGIIWLVVRRVRLARGV